MIVSTSTSDGKTNQNKAQTKSRHHRKPVNRATANGGTWIKDANDGVWQRTTKKKSKKKEGRQETAQSEENFCRFSESCHGQIRSISEVIGRWLAPYFGGDWWVIGGDWWWLAMWCSFFTLGNVVFLTLMTQKNVGEHDINIILLENKRPRAAAAEWRQVIWQRAPS